MATLTALGVAYTACAAAAAVGMSASVVTMLRSRRGDTDADAVAAKTSSVNQPAKPPRVNPPAIMTSLSGLVLLGAVLNAASMFITPCNGGVSQDSWSATGVLVAVARVVEVGVLLALCRVVVTVAHDARRHSASGRIPGYTIIASSSIFYTIVLIRDEMPTAALAAAGSVALLATTALLYDACKAAWEALSGVTSSLPPTAVTAKTAIATTDQSIPSSVLSAVLTPVLLSFIARKDPGGGWQRHRDLTFRFMP